MRKGDTQQEVRLAPSRTRGSHGTGEGLSLLEQISVPRQQPKPRGEEKTAQAPVLWISGLSPPTAHSLLITLGGLGTLQKTRLSRPHSVYSSLTNSPHSSHPGLNKTSLLPFNFWRPNPWSGHSTLKRRCSSHGPKGKANPAKSPPARSTQHPQE